MKGPLQGPAELCELCANSQTHCGMRAFRIRIGATRIASASIWSRLSGLEMQIDINVHPESEVGSPECGRAPQSRSPREYVGSPYHLAYAAALRKTGMPARQISKPPRPDPNQPQWRCLRGMNSQSSLCGLEQPSVRRKRGRRPRGYHD